MLFAFLDAPAAPHNMAIWWTSFHVFVAFMLALDLGVFHHKSHVVKVKESLIWTAVWIALALAFNLWIYFEFGKVSAQEFLAGYLLEKSLSVDNLFVFALIFSYFHVPAKYQHKVLFWGIIGALLMRAVFIFAGVALVDKFHWMLYIFGAMLIYTGIKMALEKDKEIHPEHNPVLRLFRKWVPVTKDYVEDHFIVKEAGRTLATPLLVVLVMVEVTDLLFAIDSIPAVLGVTRDPFIVYTSNVMAILGLRSLYFALANIVQLFKDLHYGLAAILVFVGLKMCGESFLHIDTSVSLIVIASILAISIVSSIIRHPPHAPQIDPNNPESPDHLSDPAIPVPKQS